MSAQHDELGPLVAEMLHRRVSLPDRGIARVDQLVRDTPQQRHPWPAYPSRRSQAMFSPPRLVAVAAAALVVATALPTLSTLRPREEPPLPAVAATSPSVQPTAVATLAPAAETDAPTTPAPEPTVAPVLAIEDELEPTSEPVTEAATAASDGRGSKSIAWDNGGTRLEADRVVLRTGGKTFRAKGRVAAAGDPGGPNRRTLEMTWREHGVQQRIYLYLQADDDDWWVREIWTYDGFENGEWLMFKDLERLTRTPRGEPFNGNLRLSPDRIHKASRRDELRGAELRIDGMRLTAFEPGTGPAPLQDCERPPRTADRRELRAAWSGLTPAQADAELEALGYCREYRYNYAYETDDGIRIRDERWCAPPPAGQVRSAFALGRYVVLFVDDGTVYERRRARSYLGVGCPVDDGTISPHPTAELVPAPIPEDAIRRSEIPGLDQPMVGVFGQIGTMLDIPSPHMIAGQRQRISAYWCGFELCRPQEMNWKVESGDKVRITRKAGPWTEVVAGDRPGSVLLGASHQMFDAVFDVLVHRPPEAKTKSAVSPTRRRSVQPERVDLDVGQYVVFTGWRCPIPGQRRYGRDGMPGTSDDACRPSGFDSTSGLASGSGLTEIARIGPSALFRVDEFGSLDHDVRYVGLNLRHAGDGPSSMPVFYVRDRIHDGPLLGDLDADGDVDAGDVAVIDLARGADAAVIERDGDGWDEGLDINADGRLDDTDKELIGALIEART